MSTNYKINSPKVIHETIDGEVVVVNLDEKDYYSLLKVAADIWNRIERGISKENIIAELSQQYNHNCEEIESSINSFLKELELEQLIMLTTNNVLTSKSGYNTTIQTQVTQAKLEFEPPILEKFTNMKDSP
ncbi:PqqD family protein [Nostoc sp. NMS4]|uniref:PqqD family protein n=1 Tax=Nostoc sp. NMS4 TaxID=2815390 RepID=UPI0025CF070F|nr:PqqD family protein [Nostoc sp. NMS4]MBN3925478.1 PqqD family protein [Nostoc sp. NMS4]